MTAVLDHIVTRRSFLAGTAAVVLVAARKPRPTPPPPQTGTAFKVGQSFTGGPDVLGGQL